VYSCSCLVFIVVVVLCVLLLVVLCVLLLVVCIVVLYVLLLVVLCVVVVVLFVLLPSYMYCCTMYALYALLYNVCITVFFFRCRTAGYKSVFGRSCDRPPRHRFFSVFLCL